MPSELDQPPLSADLEWMLSSSQVSQEYLLEALVREYYVSLHRLAHILLNDEKSAERVIWDTIDSVIKKRQRYHEQTRIDIWLYRVLLESAGRYLKQKKDRQASPSVGSGEEVLWGALDEFDPSTRILVCLHYLYGLPIEEIAQVLGSDKTSIQTRLDDARRWLRLLRPQRVPDGDSAEAWVRESIGRRWPQRDYDETELQKLIMSLTRQIEQGDRRKKTIVLVQQVLSTVVIVALVGLTGWLSSNIFRGRPMGATSASVTPFKTHTSQSKKTTPIKPILPFEPILPHITKTLSPLLPPLNMSSGIEQIRQRMFISRSLWKRAWVDALLIRYGPPGYAGPAQVYRNQLWISNPISKNATERQLVISGLVYDDPMYTLYTQGQEVYTVDLRSSMQYTYPRGSANPIHDLASPVHLGMYGYDQRGLLDGTYLSDMLFSAGFVSQLGDLKIVEQNQYLDREILILTNQLDNGITEQLMVDTQTGMTLNWLGYLTDDPDSALAEIIVLSLDFDVPFPVNAISSTFIWREPINWVDRGRFLQMDPHSARELSAGLFRAEFYSARPRIDQHIPPPPDFNPSASCLTLQWPDVTVSEGGRSNLVEVFADGYYLGETLLSDPWQILCERAASGDKIACIEPPPGLRSRLYTRAKLSWFELANPADRVDVLPESEVMSSDFAFSPDDRYLVFWACMDLNEGCGVYVHDTQTDENKLITPLQDGATYFVWSSDNQYLAFVKAGPNIQYSSSLVVVDVETGRILDQGAFLWPEFSLPVDSPVRDWGVKFPPVQGEFESCNPVR